MLKLSHLSLVVLAFAGSANAASNCDDILAQIDAKIRAAGVTRFTLTTVDVDATVSGKIVGSCERGSKKIVYETETPAPRRGSDGILTECKDGSVSNGGDCRK